MTKASKTCRRGHDNWYYTKTTEKRYQKTGNRVERYCRTCNTLNARKARGKYVPELEPQPMTREEEIEHLARTQYDDSDWKRRGWTKTEVPFEDERLHFRLDLEVAGIPYTARHKEVEM